VCPTKSPVVARDCARPNRTFPSRRMSTAQSGRTVAAMSENGTTTRGLAEFHGRGVVSAFCRIASLHLATHILCIPRERGRATLHPRRRLWRRSHCFLQRSATESCCPSFASLAGPPPRRRYGTPSTSGLAEK
jgi:hypothetical protein